MSHKILRKRFLFHVPERSDLYTYSGLETKTGLEDKNQKGPGNWAGIAL